jgi:amidase
MMTDLAMLDAVGQAELVANGACTASELVDAAVDRIERINPQINAVIHDLSDSARAAAEGATGPLAGVPFLVKDAVCHTAGDPYHLGMQALKDAQWTEPADTWLAERFRAAGFVFVGKTNTPELASSATTEPLAYGATHNPWNLALSPGGSSGGAGAAVAAGLVPVAHGNDMGGSIRCPASCNGVVGLKPTRARTTLGPDFGEFWGPLTHEFVLARTMRDVATVLDAVAGPGPGDPYTAPAPTRPYVDEVCAPAERMRIGFRTALPAGEGGAPTHPDCVAAVEATAQLLASLGHDVEPAAVDALDLADGGAGFGGIFTVALAHDAARWSNRLGRDITSELEPHTQMLVGLGNSIRGTDYIAAIERAQSYARSVATFWNDHDVLVVPTLPDPPLELGIIGGPNSDAARMGRVVTFLWPFDITGQPAMSLPLSWNAAGVPIGVQLVAAYGREDVLLRLGAQIEAAQPWADRRPPVHA